MLPVAAGMVVFFVNNFLLARLLSQGAARRSTAGNDAGARIAKPSIHVTGPTSSIASVVHSNAFVAASAAARTRRAPEQACTPPPKAW